MAMVASSTGAEPKVLPDSSGRLLRRAGVTTKRSGWARTYTPLICQRRLGRLEGWGNEGGWFVQAAGSRAGGSLGDYGWSVKTPASAEGHEVITRNAIGPSREIQFTVAGRPMKNTLSPADVD